MWRNRLLLEQGMGGSGECPKGGDGTHWVGGGREGCFRHRKTLSVLRDGPGKTSGAWTGVVSLSSRSIWQVFKVFLLSRLSSPRRQEPSLSCSLPCTYLSGLSSHARHVVGIPQCFVEGMRNCEP